MAGQPAATVAAPQPFLDDDTRRVLDERARRAASRPRLRLVADQRTCSNNRVHAGRSSVLYLVREAADPTYGSPREPSPF